LSAEISSGCISEALHAAGALHLRDVTRVDMMVDRDGHPWVLEVNVSPGMTETSLLPTAALAAGMSLSDLCDRVLRSAIARRNGRQHA
jgi:D-alanine-D-alanine ligase